jgi:acyl-coenzyme A thioesterase PaaI-like protein
VADAWPIVGTPIASEYADMSQLSSPLSTMDPSLNDAQGHTGGNPLPRPYGPARRHEKLTFFEKIEAFISRLSTRDNFWSSVCSFIWLPLAFFSGIKMKQLDGNTFSAVLPFRRFNKNWYNAMAGGALLANSEIAGGMYVFGVVGGDYAVVCKNLQYTFYRPCLGPAVYRITPRENVHELVAKGTEFNITVDMEILQQSFKQDERDKRVGKCECTFHVTPKAQIRAKLARRKASLQQQPADAAAKA